MHTAELRVLSILRSFAGCALALSSASIAAAVPVDLGSRLELFVDHHIVEKLDNTRLKLGQPQPRQIALRFDRPWEVPFAGALSVIRADGVYRLYYRGAAANEKGDYDWVNEVTCYAESTDGISWVKPSLRIHEFRGSKANNIILPPGNSKRYSHNFVPFIDSRPGIASAEKYKGIGGTGGVNGQGLFRLVSADGIHWRELPGAPLFKGYALDTLNIAFWSPAENSYVAYIRTWSEGGTPDRPRYAGYRTISRSVSKDFLTWSEPQRMSFGDSPKEELYTIGAYPYFRAPHLIIALPFRFTVGRNVLSSDEIQAFGVHTTKEGAKSALGAGHALGGLSDAALMSSRGGNEFDRTFMESFIRPGLERRAWTARSNVPAFGIVATGEDEISIYVQTGYTTNDYHIRRYTLRTDGFASVNAPFAGGSLQTKPLIFSGQRLVINYSTSSVGQLRVGITDEAGQPFPGFSLEECDEIVGDEIKRTVSWKTRSDIASLAGRTVRLSFAMKDADLYSLQFQPGSDFER
jgi:hypothetical protein